MNTNNVWPTLALSVTEASDEPLHGQLTRQIRPRILSGSLDVGAVLPSIRKLARSHRVSVITVQRTYDDLERDGLIEARRGKGFFVRSLSVDEKRTLAETRLERAMARITQQAAADGLEPDQIRGVLEHVLATRGTP